ncbi:MAG: YafY family protein [Candidatus Zixiibacteriota bacterium]
MGMSKYDRLLYILNLLRSRKSLNARRLADECQVTERSIYRDLISLSEANVPIYYDNGYKLASGNFLPPLNFTLDEYTCLRLALESTPLAKAGRKADTLRQIKAKIDCCLPQATREMRKMSRETAHIEIDTTITGRATTRFYGVLERAISEQRSVDLEYDSLEHGLTRRLVDPYFIIFRRHAFYFVGYCHLRRDFRTFRIDRLRSLTTTETKFTRRKEISASDYFAGSWELHHGEPVEVVVEFQGRASRVVTDSRHHPSETIERLDNDRIRYRVIVNGTDEIRRWLLGFGADAVVIAPDELRRELGEIGRLIADRYRKRRRKRS